jgi:hypothetical protein
MPRFRPANVKNYRASIWMVRRDNQDGKFLVGRFLGLLLRI